MDEGSYRTITEKAAAEGIDVGQVCRIARMSQPAPEIVEVYVVGKDDAPLLESLFRQALPADWSTQQRMMLAPKS